MPDMKGLGDLIGDSPGIRAVRETVARLLTHQQDVRRLPSILIEGETGAGKGLLARMIHQAGPRPAGPFIDVNCAAIPDNLLESEMFGFERGAFTDARRSKAGLFQAANGGTIFLDEVGLLPEALQAKLLKVLEERKVRRLGATRDEPIDVWVLTATNEDLRVSMRDRRFREDLYHRLAILTVTLPPLRERGGDITTLAEHFLERTCAEYGIPRKPLTADARAALLAHPWPGNVRELSNVIERAVLLAPGSDLTAAELGLQAPPPRAAAPATGQAESPVSLDDAMREHLVEVLGQTSWNISRTAALLGISRNTLRARMDKYGLREREGAPRAAPPSRRPASVSAPPTEASPVVVTAPIVVAPLQPTPSSVRRWERRRVAFVRVALAPPTGPEAPLIIGRVLEDLVTKVASFGGALEGVGPIGLVAVFGLDAAGDAAERAAHAAMAILKAVDRAHREQQADVSARVGLHLSTVLVSVVAGSVSIDMDERRDVWPLLDELVERASLGTILTSGPGGVVPAAPVRAGAGAGPRRQWRHDPRARRPRAHRPRAARPHGGVRGAPFRARAAAGASGIREPPARAGRHHRGRGGNRQVAPGPRVPPGPGPGRGGLPRRALLSVRGRRAVSAGDRARAHPLRHRRSRHAGGDHRQGAPRTRRARPRRRRAEPVSAPSARRQGGR